MTGTGEHVQVEEAVVVCPSCGEVYDSPESAAAVVRNLRFCVNLTCLQDLWRFPLDEVLARGREGMRPERRVG